MSDQTVTLDATTYQFMTQELATLQQQVAELEAKLAAQSQKESNVLQEAENFFRLSLDMLCIAGADGYFKRLNPAWEKTLGFTPEELCAQPFIEFVHPEDREATIAAAQQLHHKNAINFENRYRCKDGSYKRLTWKSVLWGEMIYAVARDITEYKQSQAALRQSEQERLRSQQILKHSEERYWLRTNYRD